MVVHRVLVQRVPKGRAGAEHAVESGVDADSAVVIAVVLLDRFHQGLAVGVGLEVKVVAQVHGDAGGQIGLDAAPGTGLGHGLEGTVQAGDRGDAAPQALGDAQQGSGLGQLAVHPLLGGVDLFRQPGPLIHLVGPAPEHRLGQVGVAVDQARQGHQAGGVENLPGLLLRRLLGEIGDLAAVDAQEGVGQNPQLGVQGHGGDVGNEKIHSASNYKSGVWLSASSSKAKTWSFWARISSIRAM